MAESLALILENYFSNELIIFLISLLPILELRGGLIVASLFGVPWHIAAPICVIGNFLPIPFIIIFIKRIFEFLKKHGPLKKIVSKIETRGLNKGKVLIEKYPTRVLLGLFIFVGIPLPMTGAWTGALIAALFDIPYKKAIPTIFFGICMACIIMLLLAYAIPGLFGFTVN